MRRFSPPRRQETNIRMSMKHRRGNRETKKPKQDKVKVVAPTFASSIASAVKPAAPAKRK